MNFLTRTQVTNIEATPEILKVTLQDKDGERSISVDAILVAVGRSPNGKTKLIYDEATERVLGAGVVGSHAGELLGELTLAIEFGATLEDIALTIHAHPSLHETVGLAAELGAETITDLPNKKVANKKQ